MALPLMVYEYDETNSTIVVSFFLFFDLLKMISYPVVELYYLNHSSVLKKVWQFQNKSRIIHLPIHKSWNIFLP